MKGNVKISVKNLVEFVLRSGSIDSGIGDPDRAAEGSRLHRKLQKAGGKNYTAEVHMVHECEYDSVLFTVQGRADGIILDGAAVIIDEIKTTLLPPDRIFEDLNPVHRAQAMCYAFFYCVQNDLSNITVRLTYCHAETEEIKRFHWQYTKDDLEEFYTDLLDKYTVWAHFQSEYAEERDKSINSLTFPFEKYRSGQRKMAAAVYRTVRDGGKLFAQAPTGIGKTMSALFPAVKALGEGCTEKIFYLTAKTITRNVANDALQKMRGKGLKIKSVTLTAKDKICFLPERICTPRHCQYACGHFDRVNDAAFDILQSEYSMTGANISAYAEKHTVCPFELSLDLTLWCDIVIGDYNYVFDPFVSLKRFFAEAGGEYTFLADEAHNLVDRAREMYSASLSKTAFMKIKKTVSKDNKALLSSFAKVNTEMVKMRKLCGEDMYLTFKGQPADLNKKLEKFIIRCGEWLKNNPEADSEFLRLYFDALAFLKISERYDKRYITFIETKGREVLVKLYCLDPSFLLGESMSKGRASILFSATLTPTDYFMSVLGGDENSGNIMLPSPFARDNLCLLISSVSTKYKDRNDTMKKITELIFGAVSAADGNYIAYFPSYKYMNDVCEMFRERFPNVDTLMQKDGMSEDERDAFLLQFDADRGETLVGFCALGGIYSEGIDLSGGRLIGAIIVGVGLPRICPQLDVIRDYYEEENGKGFNYAYQYPGMNRVMQAAGRVIRGENDRGIVLLIDDRFSSYRYKSLFPGHWNNYKVVRGTDDMQNILENFWG